MNKFKIFLLLTLFFCLGHQKRFMLGIKRLNDIDKGLYQPNPNKIKSTVERCNFLENNEYLQK